MDRHAINFEPVVTTCIHLLPCIGVGPTQGLLILQTQMLGNDEVESDLPSLTSINAVVTVDTIDYIVLPASDMEKNVSLPVSPKDDFRSLAGTAFTTAAFKEELPILGLLDYLKSDQDQHDICKKTAAWPVIKSGYLRKSISTKHSRKKDSSNLNRSHTLPSHLSIPDKAESPSLNNSSARQWSSYYVEVRGLYMFFYSLLSDERAPDFPAKPDTSRNDSPTPLTNGRFKMFNNRKPPSMSPSAQQKNHAEIEDNIANIVHRTALLGDPTVTRTLVQYISLSEAILAFTDVGISNNDSHINMSRQAVNYMMLVPKPQTETNTRSDQVLLDVIVPWDTLESKWRMRDSTSHLETIDQIQEHIRLSELRDWAIAISVTGGCLGSTELDKLGRINTGVVPYVLSSKYTHPNIQSSSTAEKSSSESTNQYSIYRRASFLGALDKKSILGIFSRKDHDSPSSPRQELPPNIPPPDSPSPSYKSSLDCMNTTDQSSVIEGKSRTPFSMIESKILGLRGEKSKSKDDLQSSYLLPPQSDQVMVYQKFLKDIDQKRNSIFQSQESRRQRKDLRSRTSEADIHPSPPNHTKGAHKLNWSPALDSYSYSTTLQPPTIASSSTAASIEDSPHLSSKGLLPNGYSEQGKGPHLETKYHMQLELKKYWQWIWPRQSFNSAPEMQLATDFSDRVIPTESTILIKTKKIQFGGEFVLSPRSQELLHLLPLPLQKCISAIEDLGIDTEGIYRIPGANSDVEYLRALLDNDPVNTHLLKQVENVPNVSAQTMPLRSILVAPKASSSCTIDIPIDGEKILACVAEKYKVKDAIVSLDTEKNIKTLNTPASELRRKGYNTNLFNGDVHVLASLVKSILRRGLGAHHEPLFTFSLYHLFLKASKIENPLFRLAALQDVVHMLPDAHFVTLDLLCNHLANVISNSKTTRMSSRNISIVFGPTLFHEPPELKRTLTPRKLSQRVMEDMPIQCAVVETLIEYSQWIFSPKQYRMTAYAPGFLPIIAPPTLDDESFSQLSRAVATVPPNRYDSTPSKSNQSLDGVLCGPNYAEKNADVWFA